MVEPDWELSSAYHRYSSPRTLPVKVAWPVPVDHSMRGGLHRVYGLSSHPHPISWSCNTYRYSPACSWTHCHPLSESGSVPKPCCLLNSLLPNRNSMLRSCLTQDSEPGYCLNLISTWQGFHHHNLDIPTISERRWLSLEQWVVYALRECF